MGNQQMTYSSNPLDGTYGDTRLLYETDNFRGTAEVAGDDSATVVHDILDEIIDSVCHRGDSISEPTRLPPDEDQAPFNPYVFPEQNSGTENSASNLRNVGYLGKEDSDSVNIRNILENSKYEPFKNSNEDVFVDSLEGQYNYENFTKIEDDMYSSTGVCYERKDSGCLDQKYFRGKEDLTIDGEKLESISYHFKEAPIKVTDDDPSPEVNEENYNENANFINNKNNFVNKLPLEVNFCSFLPENPQMSQVIEKQLHFSTDFNSNIESQVRNLSSVEEINEIRSDDDDDDDAKKHISPNSNDESDELCPKNSVNHQFSDLEVTEKSERNEEENFDVISSAGQQNSSTVEEFANIVKEICSTIEENKPISAEFYTKICDSPDKIKGNCDKIEDDASVLGDAGSKLEESAISKEKLPPCSGISSSKEDNTTIEQIKTILKDICLSVEETSSNFKQSSSSSEESSISKEKCFNDFNQLPAEEKEPIFAEICSTIEEVSSTLKEKCPYIKENETTVKKEICCASEESCISDNKRVIEEKESTNAEICARSFVIDDKCAHSQTIPVKDAEQLSKKETIREIPPTPNNIQQLNSKEKTLESFTESLPSKGQLSTAIASPTHKDNLCSVVENSCEKNYTAPISKLDADNKEESSSSTVEEMLSLFKEICSSVENKVLPEEMRIEESITEDSLVKCSENKSRTVSLTTESSLKKSSENENKIVPLAASPLEKASENENRFTPLASLPLEKASENENRFAPLAASPLEKASENKKRLAPLAASPLEKTNENEKRLTPLAVSFLEKASENENRFTPLAALSLEKASENENRLAPLAVSPLEKTSENENRPVSLADSPLEKANENENRIAPLAASLLERTSENENRLAPLAVSPLEKTSENENRPASLADSPLEKANENENRVAPLAASLLERTSENDNRLAPLASSSLEKASENENKIVLLAESSLEKCGENKSRITLLATEPPAPVIEEIKSISSFSPSFEENSQSLEYSKPTLEEDISTMDETFQLAPESPLEEISKTMEANKLEDNVLKTEESNIKIGENHSIKSTGTDKISGVLSDSQNIKEGRETSIDESSSGSDNSKDKSLYEGSHICDLDDVISQFRHKHSQESKNSNSQITRTTKFQESLSTKNKNRPVNNKKLKKLPNSSNNENLSAPLIWSNETTNSENVGEEKATDKKEKEENVELTEKTEVIVNTKESILQQPSIKESVVTESKKDRENVNRKQLVTTKLEENKENHPFCQWSKEKDELSFQIKNLNQTQKITRFIVKELVDLISRWMEDSRKENSELKESKLKLICERDQAIEDLRSVENAFSDLHRRYEKSKTIVEEYKENENRLKQQMAESALKLKQQKEMYKLLKKRSEERLEEANAEIINVQKSQETEIAVLKAQLRKAEMKANSLEKSLEQKIRENTELSSICEDLIAKVGRN